MHSAAFLKTKRSSILPMLKSEKMVAFCYVTIIQRKQKRGDWSHQLASGSARSHFFGARGNLGRAQGSREIWVRQAVRSWWPGGFVVMWIQRDAERRESWQSRLNQSLDWSIDGCRESLLGSESEASHGRALQPGQMHYEYPCRRDLRKTRGRRQNQRTGELSFIPMTSHTLDSNPFSVPFTRSTFQN